VQANEDVVGTSRVRELEKRVRDLERLLGRKTMENEILKEAIVVARLKKPTLPHWHPGKANHRGDKQAGRQKHWQPAWGSAPTRGTVPRGGQFHAGDSSKATAAL
jgi:hypothetical protein